MCGPVHLLKTKNKLGNGVALLCTASRISCSTKTPRPKQHLTRSYLTFKTGQLQNSGGIITDRMKRLFGSSFLSQAAGQLLLSPCCGLMWFVCVRKMTKVRLCSDMRDRKKSFSSCLVHRRTQAEIAYFLNRASHLIQHPISDGTGVGLVHLTASLSPSRTQHAQWV